MPGRSVGSRREQEPELCVHVPSAWRVRVAVAGRQGLGGGIKGVMSWSPPDQPALASMALSHQLPTAGQPAPVAARVLACRLAGKGHAAGRSSPAGWAGVGPGSLRAPQGLGKSLSYSLESRQPSAVTLS